MVNVRFVGIRDAVSDLSSSSFFQDFFPPFSCRFFFATDEFVSLHCERLRSLLFRVTHMRCPRSVSVHTDLILVRLLYGCAYIQTHRCEFRMEKFERVLWNPHYAAYCVFVCVLGERVYVRQRGIRVLDIVWEQPNESIVFDKRVASHRTPISLQFFAAARTPIITFQPRIYRICCFVLRECSIDAFYTFIVQTYDVCEVWESASRCLSLREKGFTLSIAETANRPWPVTQTISSSSAPRTPYFVFTLNNLFM